MRHHATQRVMAGSLAQHFFTTCSHLARGVIICHEVAVPSRETQHCSSLLLLLHTCQYSTSGSGNQDVVAAAGNTLRRVPGSGGSDVSNLLLCSTRSEKLRVQTDTAPSVWALAACTTAGAPRHRAKKPATSASRKKGKRTASWKKRTGKPRTRTTCHKGGKERPSAQQQTANETHTASNRREAAEDEQPSQKKGKAENATSDARRRKHATAPPHKHTQTDADSYGPEPQNGLQVDDEHVQW